MVELLEAQSVAQQLLADELPQRWRHVGGVAAQAERLIGVAPSDIGLLVSAAWLHDIGYASPLVETGFHPHRRRAASAPARH